MLLKNPPSRRFFYGQQLILPISGMTSILLVIERLALLQGL